MTRRLSLNAPDPRLAVPRDPRLVSYNIEMAEVTGGTFWKPFTPAQIAGADGFPAPEPPADGSAPDLASLLSASSGLMAERPPIDLSNPKLRALARALGPSWVRVSGSWATGAYFDFNDSTGGVPPEGYRAVLTRAQWAGVLDFVRAVEGRLLISFAVVPGLGNAACRRLGGTGAWDPSQVRRLLNTAAHAGAPVGAVEFANEPNISFLGTGYDLRAYLQDQDAFYRFMRIEFPRVLIAGPCGAMDPVDPDHPVTGPLAGAAGSIPTSREIAEGASEKPDVYSYHIYAGMSERGAALGGHHWPAGEAASDEVLDVAEKARRHHEPIRDAWCPKAPLWVTESGDANCGGNTWGSTFLDVFRTADELARFSTAADGVIFHNTLASSDYGLLDEDSFAPRPNWWFLWLWRSLAGDAAYPASSATVEPLFPAGAHVYARTRADGRPGTVYLVVNNALDDELEVAVHREVARFTLSAPGAPGEGPVAADDLRTQAVALNGAPLELTAAGLPPALGPLGVREPAGNLVLAPGTVTMLLTQG